MKALRIVYEILRSAVTDLGRRPLASALSIVAMTVAIFVFATFLQLGQGIGGFLARWADQAAVEVFIEEGTPAEGIDALVESLEADPTIRRVERIDSAAAMAEFRSMFPDFADVEQLLGENPFPSSLRLVPESPDPAKVGLLVEALRREPVVGGLRYDREWIEALSRLSRAAGWFVLGGAAILLLAALVTVGAVVRLALDDKREEVHLMRLVGAPVSFVIGPVLLSGALLGAIGSALALGLASAARGALLSAAMETPLLGFAEVLIGSGLPTWNLVALLILGMAAGTFAAGLAAGRAALS